MPTQDIDLYDDFEIADGATGAGGEHVAGFHKGTIVSLKADGPSKFNPEKERIVVEIAIEGDDSKFPARYWFNKSLGYGKEGWSNMALFIAAVHPSLEPGNPLQKKVKASDLVGHLVTVRTETNAKGWANIKEVLPYVE